MARAVTRFQMCSIHAVFIWAAARHFSPQFWGGMTFFRPVGARPLRRNGSIDEMEIGAMHTLGLSRREWVFNVLGLLVLLAVGVVS